MNASDNAVRERILGLERGTIFLTSSLLRDFQKALLNIRGLAIYAGDLG